MANSSNATALERLLRPLSQNLTAELARALVNFQADAETQARYDELAKKRTEGHLALACPECNYQKGTNLSGVDPDTGAV